MNHDPLASTLSNIQNAEKIGRKQVLSKPYNSTIGKVLDLMKTHGYIKEVAINDDKKGKTLTITLAGHINKCGVIKPRFSVTQQEYEKFEERFLPARDFGIILVSTPAGIMTHNEAKEKKLGGKLISYCY